MNFREAMEKTVEQAQKEDRVIYLYKGHSYAEWGASHTFMNDWLFKAYPGGRRVLSVEGTKVLNTLEPNNNGMQKDGWYSAVGELIETEWLESPKHYCFLESDNEARDANSERKRALDPGKPGTDETVIAVRDRHHVLGEFKILNAAMDNVIAYRLGEVGLKLMEYPREKIGDEIDRGLVLRRLLEEDGFYLIDTKPR